MGEGGNEWRRTSSICARKEKDTERKVGLKEEFDV